ncbi:MAG: sigma-70 family RNA polymerase sigma factor [Planctomycetota bacterium]|nr:sigma-70 family RNA polymerase sigma factor [Planctomycetota bacterium]
MSLENDRNRFETTAWSVVLRAQEDASISRPALEELLSRYWTPLYFWLRRSGKTPIDAEDIVQSFFTWMIEKQIVGYADPNRGRFRRFLLAAMTQFLAKRHQYDSAAKRVPGKPVFSLPQNAAEEYFRLNGRDDRTPEQEFERNWSLETIRRTWSQLGDEYRAKDKTELFSAIVGLITDQRDESTLKVAEQLGLSDNAIRVAVHRARKRFGQLLRKEVAETLESVSDVDDELKSLLDAITS